MNNGNQVQSNKNNFFGIKVSQPGINVSRATDSQLLYKNDYSQQTFFAQNSAITFGVLSDGGVGEQITDSSGNVLFKLEGPTWFWYDPNTGNTTLEIGQLPAGNYGELFYTNGIPQTLAGTRIPNILNGLSSAESGFFVAAEGVDVQNATDSQLIFNSAQNFFKIVQTGTVTVPGLGPQAPFDSGATGLTVPHNLGYIPAFSAFALMPVVQVAGQPPVAAWNQSLPTVGADTNQMTYNLQCGTDINNIYFVDFWANNVNTTPVQSFDVTYYLFTASIG